MQSLIVRRLADASERCPSFRFSGHGAISPNPARVSMTGNTFSLTSRAVPAHITCAPHRRETKRADNQWCVFPAHLKTRPSNGCELRMMRAKPLEASDWLRLSRGIQKAPSDSHFGNHLSDSNPSGLLSATGFKPFWNSSKQKP